MSTSNPPYLRRVNKMLELVLDSAVSPLDVKGVDLKISSAEIVDFIHESRKL